MTVTLAQIEQATAPRLGPYSQRVQSSATAADATHAYFDEFKTSTNVVDVVNQFMLRRGQKTDGTTIAVAAGDRQRIVASQDSIAGAAVPDRAWVTPPVAGEYVEFHHTDPALELRQAVLSGLRRCFFEDRAQITLTTAAPERDLSAAVPWITRPDQVRRYQFTTTGATLLPVDVPWAQPFEKGGHVWLGAWPDEYPNTLLVTALRPHFTWVNGADSTNGPTADADTLSVDLDYAAAAAHIEAWRLFPAKLKMAADGGYQASQPQAAAEFTRLATAQRRRRRTGWSLTAPFGENRLSVRAR
jgi:hypothetical protein